MTTLAASAPSRRLILGSLFLLGVGSQWIQAWLIREVLVVFYGNEASLGAFFGSWLLWVALGALAILCLRSRPWVRDAARGLSHILLLLPLLVISQILATRGIRLLLDTPSTELVPLGQAFVAILLLTLPSAVALGLAFPLACKALAARDAPSVIGGISWLYVAEAAGALLGGMLFTFVVIPWLGLWHGLAVLTPVLAWTAWRLHPSRRTAMAGGLAAALALLLFTPLGKDLQFELERFRFNTLQPGLTLLDAVETRYGHVAIARLGDQISVVQDGRIASSFPQPRAVQQTAAYVYAQAPGARRLLLFGSFASGLAAELLRYPVEHIDLVLQDRVAFEHLRPYLTDEHRAALADPRLQLHFIDGRRYLRGYQGPAYDLVLVLDAAPSNAHSNRYFTREFYQALRARMRDDGVLCTRVSSASNYLGGTVRSYAGSVYRTLSESFAQVAIQPGDVQTLCATPQPGRVTEDPAELARRYLAVKLDEHRFPASSFESLMPAERIAYLHYQYETRPGELNSDSRPVTFYLNMLLWARYTASSLADHLAQLRTLGAWPYLVPVLVFLSLWGLRTLMEAPEPVVIQRQAGIFSLALVGLVAMALQLIVLFSYQAHVGFMFERVALINALFMSGLALGTGLIGRAMALRGRAEHWLIGLLLVMAGLLWLTPQGLDWLGQAPTAYQEAGYLAVSALFGLLTGAGFPLGVNLSQRSLREAAPTGGVAEAADSVGGAFGGVLTGALLIPLLGMEGTCRLLMLLSLLVLLPLAWARWTRLRIEPLAVRGVPSFPWRGLSWTLAFVVLVAFGWSRLAQQTTLAPQLHFDQTVLAEVSGSRVFREKDAPFIHYRGWDAPDADTRPAPDTASLSSMAVAADIRGYGGPINLLVSVDASGHLRGVRYVASHETPSYIARIDAWLAGLRGVDLAAAPLDLQRVDAITGATVTSKAALATINRAAAAAGEQVFGRRFASGAEQGLLDALLTPRFLVTLALLAASIPIYLSGSEPARLALQAASLVVFGFWLNSLVTEVDLVNLLNGHLASFLDNPQRWLLLGFVLITGLLFGQMWCGYLCPFGALQELISRLGRRLGLRRYVHRPLGQRLRYLKFVLLSLMLVAVFVTGDASWAGFNPMQHFFGRHLEGVMTILAAIVLLGALVYVRFWCRYLCPMGAFLALSNKLALLDRFAAPRRFEHCDLGVRSQFDVDCIRCNRCLTARDTHVRRREHD